VAGFGAAALVFAFDQLSKVILIDVMAERGFQPLEVTGFFNLVMVWNRGVSFGMLGGGEETTRWLLTVFAVVVAGGLLWWMRKQTRRLAVLAMGLIAGGALGNALDRVIYGAVADFFDVHASGWSWPAFNIADSAITVGVVLLVIDAFVSPRKGADGKEP